jgi:hypothetical protein
MLNFLSLHHYFFHKHTMGVSPLVGGGEVFLDISSLHRPLGYTFKENSKFIWSFANFTVSLPC